MRKNRSFSMLALAALLGATSLDGCKRSEPKANETGEAELHSAEMPRPAQKTVDDGNAYLAAVRREQLGLQARIREHIEGVDGQLRDLQGERSSGGRFVDPRSPNGSRIRALLDRRLQLEQNLATVERADERGWDELKANVEKDLEADPHDRN